MGSGLSNLSLEQKIELTKLLRNKYEYLIAAGLELNEFQCKITEECHQILERLLSESADVGDDFPGLSTIKIGGTFDEVDYSVEHKSSKNATPKSGRSIKVPLTKIPSIRGKLTPTASPKNIFSPKRVRRKSFDNANGELKLTINPTVLFQSQSTVELPKLRDFSTNVYETDSLASVVQITEMRDSPLIEPSVIQSQPKADDNEMKLDCWDSVAMQPFCTICKMAFKSDYILDRHVKFSQIHQAKMKEMNIKSQEVELQEHIEQIIRCESNGDVDYKPSNDVIQLSIITAKINQMQLLDDLTSNDRMKEGIDYHLLYVGTKFYWRSQKKIDYRFYHHVNCNIIEIIGFDPTLGREFNRILLSLPILDRLIEPKILEELEIIRKAASEKKNSVKPDYTALREEFQRTFTTVYILQRLQLAIELPPEEVGGRNLDIIFVKLTGDDSVDLKDKFGQSIFPLLDVVPKAYNPILISQRRNSTVEEIKHEFEEMKRDKEIISQSRIKADEFSKLSEVRYETPKSYKDNKTLERKGRALLPHYTIPTNSLVIKQNTVEAAPLQLRKNLTTPQRNLNKRAAGGRRKSFDKNPNLPLIPRSAKISTANNQKTMDDGMNGIGSFGDNAADMLSICDSVLSDGFDTMSISLTSKDLGFEPIQTEENTSTNGGTNELTSDYWDSVTAQPFCTVCEMAFDSLFMLENHRKYSPLHFAKEEAIQGNKFPVEHQESSPSQPVPTETDVVTESTHSIKNTTDPGLNHANDMVEGVDYHLLYVGTKFYWRSKVSIDYRLYHHIHKNIIEVVGLDAKSGTEYNRILLNYLELDRLISSKVQDEVDRKLPDPLESPNETRLSIADSIRVDTHRSILTTYILQRLQIESNMNDSEISNNFVVFSKLDESESVPLTHQTPDGYCPVQVLSKINPSVISENSLLSFNQEGMGIQEESSITNASRINAAAGYMKPTTSAVLKKEAVIIRDNFSRKGERVSTGVRRKSFC